MGGILSPSHYFSGSLSLQQVAGLKPLAADDLAPEWLESSSSAAITVSARNKTFNGNQLGSLSI